MLSANLRELAMTPEMQMLFNIVVGVAGALGGWWLKVMWDSLTELQKADRQLVDRVASIEVLVAGTYIKRTDFEKVADALFKKLDLIQDKLNEKVDK
jgi:uncharacterized membrane protein YeaQ/YmgE (transglycosylase-associated protein family)